VKTITTNEFDELAANARRLWVLTTHGYAVRICAKEAKRCAALAAGLGDKMPCFGSGDDLYIDCMEQTADFQVSK
jgi:hypothetical protein